MHLSIKLDDPECRFFRAKLLIRITHLTGGDKSMVHRLNLVPKSKFS